MDLMKGKKGLIFGVSNTHGIAYGIAKEIYEAGQKAVNCIEFNNDLKLAFLNIRKNIKNEKELKSAFIISIVGMMLNNAAFLILWFYFGKIVGELNGWKAEDIFGLYAINSFAFGVVNAFFYGMVEIPNYIVTGNLDNFLLTPKNLLLKIS